MHSAPFYCSFKVWQNRIFLLHLLCRWRSNTLLTSFSMFRLFWRMNIIISFRSELDPVMSITALTYTSFAWCTSRTASPNICSTNLKYYLVVVNHEQKIDVVEIDIFSTLYKAILILILNINRFRRNLTTKRMIYFDG